MLPPDTAVNLSGSEIVCICLSLAKGTYYRGKRDLQRQKRSALHRAHRARVVRHVDQRNETRLEQIAEHLDGASVQRILGQHAPQNLFCFPDCVFFFADHIWPSTMEHETGDGRADHTDARQKHEGSAIKRASRWLPAFVCEQAGEKQISATVHTGSFPFCRRLDEESGILTHSICLCT
jgi:hypothetical protein